MEPSTKGRIQVGAILVSIDLLEEQVEKVVQAAPQTSAESVAHRTVVEQHVDMLRRVAEVVAGHPAGKHVRLMFAPEGLDLEADEVLVQHVKRDRRVVELVPRKLTDLALQEVIHDSQVLDPGDESFNRYAEDPKAARCLVRYDLYGNCVHIYD